MPAADALPSLSRTIDTSKLGADERADGEPDDAAAAGGGRGQLQRQRHRHVGREMPVTGGDVPVHGRRQRSARDRRHDRDLSCLGDDRLDDRRGHRRADSDGDGQPHLRRDGDAGLRRSRSPRRRLTVNVGAGATGYGPDIILVAARAAVGRRARRRRQAAAQPHGRAGGGDGGRDAGAVDLLGHGDAAAGDRGHSTGASLARSTRACGTLGWCRRRTRCCRACGWPSSISTRTSTSARSRCRAA